MEHKLSKFRACFAQQNSPGLKKIQGYDQLTTLYITTNCGNMADYGSAVKFGLDYGHYLF